MLVQKNRERGRIEREGLLCSLQTTEQEETTRKNRVKHIVVQRK